jgi:hypothetical protein
MDNETDLDVLNAARNVVLYSGKKSALVEWTLSDAWTEVDRHDKPIPRGLVRKCGFLIALNQVSGEI